jgi:hypothetical protein
LGVGYWLLRKANIQYSISNNQYPSKRFKPDNLKPQRTKSVFFFAPLRLRGWNINTVANEQEETS